MKYSFLEKEEEKEKLKQDKMKFGTSYSWHTSIGVFVTPYN